VEQAVDASKKKVQSRSRATPASGQRGSTVDYETLARFRYELRKFQAFSKSAAARAGLTFQQHQALLTIRGFSGKGPLTVGDLAHYLLIRHHTAVELVDRMTKLKILSRSSDNADARRVLVRLTKQGERRLQDISKINQEELRAIGPTLTKLLRLVRRG
jgi:DNA-binding MarR family transcriptional regulator